MKTLTEEQVLARIKKRVGFAGSQAEFAKAAGINRSVLCDVVNGRRDPTTALLDHLGLERIVLYKEKE